MQEKNVWVAEHQQTSSWSKMSFCVRLCSQFFAKPLKYMFPASSKILPQPHCTDWANTRTWGHMNDLTSTISHQNTIGILLTCTSCPWQACSRTPVAVQSQTVQDFIIRKMSIVSTLGGNKRNTGRYVESLREYYLPLMWYFVSFSVVACLPIWSEHCAFIVLNTWSVSAKFWVD